MWGLNLSSIGIEMLEVIKIPTPEQLKADIELVKYLKEKYKTIEYLVGIMSIKIFEKHPVIFRKR